MKKTLLGFGLLAILNLAAGQIVNVTTAGVGIGTPTPNAAGGGTVRTYLTVSGSGATYQAEGAIEMVNPKNTPASGDYAGALRFISTGNSADARTAMIYSNLEGTGGASGYGGILTLETKGNNSTTQNLVVLNSAGNVGIGTTTPNYGSTGGRGLSLVTSSVGNPTVLDLVGQTGSDGVVFSQISAFNGLGTQQVPSSQISFRRANSGNDSGTIGFSTVTTNGGSLTERMRIDNSGNVGIGTTTPDSPLTLNTGGFPSAHIKSSHSYGVGLHLESTASNVRYQLQAIGSDSVLAGRNGNFEIQNYNTGSVPLTITNGGNIGINNVGAPGYPLTVNGTVRGTRFIADVNTYSDFVFKLGYRLAPLTEVEAAIKTQGHLPDIPSEAEARAHGVDVGEMQTRLLQKVEELTLHLIAHEKELQQLRAENETLRRNVANLAHQ